MLWNSRICYTYLFDLFFNSIVNTISPKESREVLSEITLQSVRQSAHFRDIFATFAASFAYSSDLGKQKHTTLLHNMAMSKVTVKVNEFDVDLDCKLHSVIFSVLRQVCITSNNLELINELQEALRILTLHRPRNPSPRFKVLVESFLYNFAVSIVVTPQHILDSLDVFAICKKMRTYFPRVPTIESNPLLGSCVEFIIIVAEASHIFRCRSSNYLLTSQLLDEINNHILLLLNGGHMSCPHDIFSYINVVAVKLLLLHCLPLHDKMESTRLINDTVEKLIKARSRIGRIEAYGIWGLFMFGLTLDDLRSQSVIVDYLRLSNERRKSAKLEVAIKCLRYAWRHQAGFEILREEQFIVNVCLN